MHIYITHVYMYYSIYMKSQCLDATCTRCGDFHCFASFSLFFLLTIFNVVQCVRMCNRICSKEELSKEQFKQWCTFVCLHSVYNWQCIEWFFSSNITLPLPFAHMWHFLWLIFVEWHSINASHFAKANGAYRLPLFARGK